MGHMFKRPLGRIPYRGHISEVHRTKNETASIPVNKAIRQYFENASIHNASSQEEWLQTPELPTADEILGTDAPGDDVLLAPNQISGPWPSKEEYLKTHYFLIREDSVAPLRDAVTMVRNNPQMNDAKNISIYEKVSPFEEPGSKCEWLILNSGSGLHHQSHTGPTWNRIPNSLLHQACWKEDPLGVFEPPHRIFRRRPLPGTRCVRNKVCRCCCCSEASGECHQEPS